MRLSVTRGLARIVAASLLATPLPALAKPPPVGVAPIDAGGEAVVAAEDQSLWQQALTKGVTSTKVNVVLLDQRCGDAECFAALATAKKIRRIVELEIAVLTNDYKITVSVMDEQGRQLDTREAHCEICTAQDVAARITETTAELGPHFVTAEAPEVPKAVAAVSISSDPPGATVFIDDEDLGTTPLEAELDPGEHALKIAQDGFVAHEETFSARGGAHATFSVSLTPEDAGAPRGKPAPRRKPWMWTTGLVLGAGGLAAAGAGAALVAIDSRPVQRRCTGDSVDVNGTCEWLHDTIAGGAIAVSVGAAALGVGIGLAVAGRKQRKSRQPSKTARVQWIPSAGGLAAAF